MTHNELIEVLEHTAQDGMADQPILKGLRAVVELHYRDFGTPGENVVCDYCKVIYPCPTIQAIEKELT